MSTDRRRPSPADRTDRALRPSARRRREELLRAGMALAGERGMAGVTHRAVAARAGVSLGSTSYFFSSLDDLLAEALRLFVRERSAELAALIDPDGHPGLGTGAGPDTDDTGDADGPGPDDGAEGGPAAAGPSPEELAGRVAAALIATDRTRALAEIEAYLHAARHPELRPAVHEAFTAFDRVTEAALVAGGARRARTGARAFTALADGFLLRHLADPRPDDADALRDALLSLAIAHAMPDTERERWRERLQRPVAGGRHRAT